MSTTIDARGLSCPQPVLLTLEAIKKTAKGQLTVLVDTDTSKENVLARRRRSGVAGSRGRGAGRGIPD